MKPLMKPLTKPLMKPLSKPLSKPPFLPPHSPQRKTPERKTPEILGFLTEGKNLKPSTKEFTVLGRRFGKFKSIGTARTKKQALYLGKEWARKGLGVTFTVKGAKNQPLKLRGFKTKKTRTGIQYLQLPKYRLSRKTEVGEIQFFKSLKGGKKKKK